MAWKYLGDFPAYGGFNRSKYAGSVSSKKHKNQTIYQWNYGAEIVRYSVDGYGNEFATYKRVRDFAEVIESERQE